MGMFVEFRAVPGRDSGRSRDRDSAGHDTIYYGKRLPPAKTRARRVAQAWLYDNGAWVACDSRVEAPAAVKQMPRRCWRRALMRPVVASTGGSPAGWGSGANPAIAGGVGR